MAEGGQFGAIGRWVSSFPAGDSTRRTVLAYRMLSTKSQFTSLDRPDGMFCAMIGHWITGPRKRFLGSSVLESIHQEDVALVETQRSPRDMLVALLSQDLDFHDQVSDYASHNVHSFPAKFPPQLPRKFICALTNPGESVLDPMMGSGTTVLEALLAGRQAIGIDIDPLAVLMSKVKTTPANTLQVATLGDQISHQASLAVKEKRQMMETELQRRWDSKTKEFVDYWFATETQLELQALVEQIQRVTDADWRSLLMLTLSSIIITKSGGVSFALDLGHTRPHKARHVANKDGEVVFGESLPTSLTDRDKLLSKTIGSPLQEFGRRFRKNLNGLLEHREDANMPLLAFGDAQCLPITDGTVSLIVTSPPYASNAIDYMRAHKFSLVWLGHALDDLSAKRREYIGGEVVADGSLEALPPGTAEVVMQIGKLDRKKGRVLHRYYSEMTRALREMFRVLKPGKIAIVVVGTSVMRGRNTETATCLAEIGISVGFDVPKIGVRSLDRDRRMLPAAATLDVGSQIQQRMYEEYVIGFLKPEA